MEENILKNITGTTPIDSYKIVFRDNIRSFLFKTFFFFNPSETEQVVSLKFNDVQFDFKLAAKDTKIIKGINMYCTKAEIKSNCNINYSLIGMYA